MPGPDPLPVRDGYALWASSYDSDVNATRDLDAAVFRQTTLPLAGAHVIEIGAGTGKNTVYLAAHAASVLALDASSEMLARARDRVTVDTVTFHEHDIRTVWPVPDEAADIVVCNLVLEHIADLAPVFAEARRALRPGGLFVMAELHPFRQWRGSGAQFDGGRRVEAYVHAVSDYVGAALGAGFVLSGLREIGDAADPTAPGPALPRLLQLRLMAA